MAELSTWSGEVREINELSIVGRKLIEELARKQDRSHVCKDRLDTLIVTLTLHLQERDQLRA